VVDAAADGALYGRQFSDKPLHKQIRSLFNQFLMIFIDP
jgi:hypothetical protein